MRSFESFEREVLRHRWEDLRQCSEEWRKDLPQLLAELITADSEPKASEAYFRLEGACFPQRLVTQSCVAVVHCLLAGLAGRPPDYVRGWIFEALRGIVVGEPLLAEVELGNASLMDDCHRAAGRGFWLLQSLVPQCSGPDLKNLQVVLNHTGV